jgi:hypothetical protein
MHIFCNQTRDAVFTKDLLSTLSIPMSEEKLKQEEGAEMARKSKQVGKQNYNFIYND